jgi:hypothetical protein
MIDVGFALSGGTQTTWQPAPPLHAGKLVTVTVAFPEVPSGRVPVTVSIPAAVGEYIPVEPMEPAAGPAIVHVAL